MTWSREDLAWMAGLIEGEGYIGGSRSSSEQFGVRVAMTDLDVLETLRRLAGVGSIYGPCNKSRSNRKDIWEYRCNGREAYALLVATVPWLHSRRQEVAVAAIRNWLPKRRGRWHGVRPGRHSRLLHPTPELI